MSRKSSKTGTLQEGLMTSDESWIFSIRDFSVDDPNQIKVLTFKTNARSRKSFIYLQFETTPVTRITRHEPSKALVIARFGDFRLSSGPGSQSDSIRITGEYIERFLKTGVEINGERYNFFGHSPNQFNSRSCFLYAASKQEIKAKIEDAADVTQIRSVAKLAKRIGLLFVEASIVRGLSPASCQDIDDILRNGYNFTDGCGFISERFAREIARNQKIIFRSKFYTPSIFQIRYRGYKGILSVQTDLDAGVDIQFRRSMRKFNAGKDLSFLLNSFSKPYNFGYLNDEIVILLRSLGISSKVLEHKQSQHIDLLQQALKGHPQSVFSVLSFLNKQELAEEFLLDGFAPINERIKRIIDLEFGRMLGKGDSYRCRILVPKSRLLFGIADPSTQNGQPSRIPQGACYVRITDLDGKAVTLCNSDVLVTRNPCLHPGDLRRLTVVDVPELAHLIDCIVFSTEGDRPAADTMAGGDLDGDRFFVSWDTDLIPPELSQSARYTAPETKLNLSPITNDDRAKHFAVGLGPILGQLKHLYCSWAAAKGPLSAECQQINRLFSHSVDGGRVQIPPELEHPPERNADGDQFILDILHNSAKEKIDNYAVELQTNGVLDRNLLELLLNNSLLAVSEFELIKLTVRWCRANDAEFMDYANVFDYNRLDDNEQTWVLNSIPPTRDFPAMVKNALLQSDILVPEQLHTWRLDHPRIHWRKVFGSSVDRMDRFMDATCHALEHFNHKLVIFRPDDRFAIAIYIPQTVYRGVETLVDDKVRVFSFADTKEYNSENYTSTPTIQNYRIYCDEYKLQLYHGKKGSTFVFLAHSSHIQGARRGAKARLRGQDLDDRGLSSCLASIALEKINERVRKQIGTINRNRVTAAEIFVISNRDTRSLQLLDLWLNYVDTRVVHPLLKQRTVISNTPPTVESDLINVPTALRHIIQDHALESIERLSSLEEIDNLLTILAGRGQVVRLRSIFVKLLEYQAAPSSRFDRTVLAGFLLRCLQKYPYLVSSFLSSQLWIEERLHLAQDLNDLGASILKSLVMAADLMGELVFTQIAMVLEELKSISLLDWLQVIETAAFSICNLDMAVDLLTRIFYQTDLKFIDGEIDITRALTNSAVGIALEHIDEAAHAIFFEERLILFRDDKTGGNEFVKAMVRIDLPLAEQLRAGQHVYFRQEVKANDINSNASFKIDALVVSVEGNIVQFQCLQKLPLQFSASPWQVFCCGSSEQTKRMFEAIKNAYLQYQSPAELPSQAILRPTTAGSATVPQIEHRPEIIASIVTQNFVTLIQTPPGTVGMAVICAAISKALQSSLNAKVLVVSTEDRRVDEIFNDYIQESSTESRSIVPVRWTTRIQSIDPTLLSYVYEEPANNSGNLAARLVFTRCIEANSSVLMDQSFDLVVIDDACNQIEPLSYVPLLKSRRSVMLLGDHASTSPRTRVYNQTTQHHIPLFQRLWQKSNTVSKISLNLQNQLHADVAAVISSLFYAEKLESAKGTPAKALRSCSFPWPQKGRVIFVHCSSWEDIGDASKTNAGQVRLCGRIYRSLVQDPGSTSSSKQIRADKYSCEEVAIITPYHKQVEALTASLAYAKVLPMTSCSDLRVDLAIIMTVRSNPAGEIGTLSDQRLLNNSLSCARSGVIIIGNRDTLSSSPLWRRLLGLCETVHLPANWHF